MSDSESNLEFVTTRELIAELITRFDNLCLVTYETIDAEKDGFSFTHAGHPMIVLGMLARAQVAFAGIMNEEDVLIDRDDFDEGGEYDDEDSEDDDTEFREGPEGKPGF